MQLNKNLVYETIDTFHLHKNLKDFKKPKNY